MFREVDMIEQENLYFDFTKITVGDILYKDHVLIVNEFAVFPDTLIKELCKKALGYLFGCESFEEVVEKYPSEKLKEIRREVLNRLWNFAKKSRPVMFITKDVVYIYTNSEEYTIIEREWFDKALLALTGSENIINYYYGWPK